MVETAKRDEGGIAARLPGSGRRTLASPVVALAAMLALAGCSSVPDYLNPVEWYEGTTDTVGGWFSDDEQEAPSSAASDDEFPNLSTVPDRPTPSTTAEEREQIQRGLVADRDNALYSDTTDPSKPADAPARATGGAAATASTGSGATPPAAASGAVPQTTVARTPPPAPRVAPSTGQSTLWPRRPAPERTPGTPVTTGRVSDSHSEVRTPTRSGQTVLPQPRDPAPQSTPPAATGGSSLDSAGNAPQGRAAQSQAAQGRVQQTPAPTPPADASAADQSPAVIVDGPSLDQYQLGFSGPAYLVGTVNFAHSSARLNASDRDLVASVAAAARETDAFVRVVGHASARTAEMSLSQHELVNFEISLARAQAVAAALISAGLPEDRVLVEAMSASQPLYFESMPSGEAGNRRAEILFQY